MQGLSSFKRKLPLISLLFLIVTVSTLRSMAAEIRGRVTVGPSLNGIDGAQIIIDRDTTDNRFDFQTETDLFGFFDIESIPASTYQLVVKHPGFTSFQETVSLSELDNIRKTINLVPLSINGVEKRFDIFTKIADVTSGLPLIQLPVEIERFQKQSDLIASETRRAITDFNGFANFRGMESGFYRFSANHGVGATQQWEGLTTATTPQDKTFLEQTHQGNFLLKPVGQDLVVRVQGWNPIINSQGVLTNIVVEIVGVNPLNPQEEVIPKRTGETFANGEVTFKQLPAIAWKILAKRMGFSPYETIVFPNANGNLPNPVVVDLALLDTQLTTILNSPYLSRRIRKSKPELGHFHDGLAVHLTGITNSNTEGIVRLVHASFDDVIEKPLATFDHILPGRYLAHVSTNLPNPFITGAINFNTILQGQQLVEVSMNKHEETELTIKPVPATIRGRLVAADDYARTDSNLPIIKRRGDRTKPVFRKHQVEGIKFKDLDGFSDLFVDDFEFSVDTNSDGTFSIQIYPGVWGVSIPSLTEYWGSQIELTRTDLAEKPTTHRNGWPYANPFLTGGSFFVETEFQSLGIPVSSGEEIRMDLFVRKQKVSVGGFVQIDPRDPAQLLSFAPDISADPAILLSDLGENGKVFLEPQGGGTSIEGLWQTGPFETQTSYFFTNMLAGTYTLRFEHPRNLIPETEIQIPEWNAPGLTPNIEPDSALDHIPLDVYQPDPIQAIYQGVEVTINELGWLENENRYEPFGQRSFDLIKPAFANGKVFRAPGFAPDTLLFPPGDYQFWIEGFESWFSASGNGPATYDVHSGGPLDKFTSPIPSITTPFSLTVESVSAEDRALKVPNTRFDIQRPGVDPFTLDGMENPNAFITFTAPKTFSVSDEKGFFSSPFITNSDGWFLSFSSELQVDNKNPNQIAVRITAPMARGMGIKGKVINENDEAVAGAKVIVRDRFGNLLRDLTSNAEGKFVAEQSLESPQVLFVEVSQLGMKPWRKRIEEFGEGDPPILDLDGDQVIKLQPLPEPSFEEIVFDRHGLFFTGIRKSGDAESYRSDSADDALTLSIAVRAMSPSFTLEQQDYDRLDGVPHPLQTLELTNRIAEIWVIDPRSYTSNAHNGKATPIAPPGNQGDISATRNWIKRIADGTIPNVFHQRFSGDALRQTAQTTWITNRLHLSQLPPGDFKPIFVAITDYGSIKGESNHNYPTKELLKGVALPPWLSSATETISTIARGKESLDALPADISDFVPEGRFTPLPNFKASIKKTPSNFLIYNYDLDINWTEGLQSPKSGLLQFAPGILGLTFGGKLNFGLDGEKGEVFADAGALVKKEIKLPRDESKDPFALDYVPKIVSFAAAKSGAIQSDLIFSINAETTASKQFDPVQQPMELESTYSVTGSAQLNTKMNLGSMSFLPGIGPVLAGLKKVKVVDINMLVDGGIGANITTTSHTVFPRYVENPRPINGPIGPTTIAPNKSPADPDPRVLRRDFIGGLHTSTQTNKLCVRLGTGIGIETLGGALGATGKLLVEGTRENCAFESLRFTFNPLGDWPILKQVDGAINARFNFFVNALIYEFKKEWVGKLATIRHEYNTEPFFELIPLNLSESISTPATASPGVFNGSSETLIDSFYGSGSFNAVSQNQTALFFTDTDPNTGLMLLKVSILDAQGEFTTPVQITAAAGIVSQASHQMNDGRWLVVWNEISSSDIDNLFPPTRIRYSISSVNGQSWNSPAEVTHLSGFARDIVLVQLTTSVGLVYSQTDNGPTSEKFTLSTHEYRDDQWTAATDIAHDINLAAVELARPTETLPGAIAYSTYDGAINLHDWNTNQLEEATNLLNYAKGKALSLVTHGSAQYLAVKNLLGEVELWKRNSSQDWAQIASALANVHPTEIRLLPYSSQNQESLLLSWIEGGDISNVWKMTFDSNGSTTSLPTKLNNDADGSYRNLQAIKGIGNQAKLIARFRDSEGDSVRQFNTTLDDTFVAVRFTTPERQVDGSIQFSLLTDTPGTYRIQYSPNLIDWVNLFDSFTPETDNPIVAPANESQRYYRAVEP